MSKFFVGQRVRLARPYFAKNQDLTGRIWQMFSVEISTTGGPANCAVAWDNGTSDAGEDELIGTATHTSQLEPILPSGHIASTLSFSELMDKCKEGVAA